MFSISFQFIAKYLKRIFRMIRKYRQMCLLKCTVTCFIVLIYFKLHTGFNDKETFQFPLNVDMPALVKQYRDNNGRVNVTPINPYPYRFTYDIPNKCNTNYSISLILMVKSAAPNFHRRSVIRDTWGNELTFKQFHYKTVFVLATPQDADTQKQIDNEARTLGDVIQLDFVDAYFNNTLKFTGALRWVTRHCKNAKFVIFVDDDFYVATDSLIEYLLSLNMNLYKKLFMGKVWDEIPVRNRSDKWYVSEEEYRYSKYPLFVSAGATIMSLKVATDVNIAIQFTKLFKLDDVFLGMVIYKLNMKPIHNDRIFISKKIGIQNATFTRILAAHKYGDPKKLRTAWEFYLNKTHPKLHK